MSERLSDERLTLLLDMHEPLVGSAAESPVFPGEVVALVREVQDFRVLLADLLVDLGPWTRSPEGDDR